MSGAVSIGRFGRAVGLFVLAGGCVFASPCRAEEPWVRPAHFAELSAAFRRPAVIDFPAANAFSGMVPLMENASTRTNSGLELTVPTILRLGMRAEELLPKWQKGAP